jgi:serine phosphatase RsbU (regulator of sigma subunit)
MPEDLKRGYCAWPRREPIVIGERPGPRAPVQPQTELGALHAELLRHGREFDRLRQIIEHLNRGTRLEEILDFLYDEFRDVMPYNRIAFATIDYDRQEVASRWARSDEQTLIHEGYVHPLGHTSLAEIARLARPRIINDLEAYARDRPQSEVTRLLLAEKMRSSLTCPLIVEGRPIGFLFFDAREPAAYSEEHVSFLLDLAGIISAAVQRGQMFSRLADHSRTIERQNHLLAEENRRSRVELEMARKVQLALIPRHLSGCARLQFAMFYQPAEAIGGDLLDVLRLGPGRAVAYVADAMGHGVPAALLMTVVSTAFRGAAERAGQNGNSADPAALLLEVNRTITTSFDLQYVTAACALVDADQGRLTLALAGHPPALVRRAGRSEVDEIAATGVPLGIDPESRYGNVEVPFASGDLLLLYTDGITEAPGPAGSRYGLAALKTALAAAPDGPPDSFVTGLQDQLRAFNPNGRLEDDRAALAVRFSP